MANITQKRDVIKHSSAVQITNEITLIQRRAWNVLIANAYDELLSSDTHSIKVRDLEQTINFDSRNIKHLKDTLEALSTCAVKWNVLQKDGSTEWGVIPLLAGAMIRGGVLTYSFSPLVRQKLFNPSMYARINLSMQNKFSSKHALALYELFVDYLDIKRSAGETPFIPIEDFRSLMGLKASEYPLFKRLNTRVIKEPVLEINRVSDLEAEVHYRREKRKVVAVKFKIKSKSKEMPLMAAGSESGEGRADGAAPSTKRYDDMFAALPLNEQELILQEAEEALPDFVRQYKDARQEIAEKVYIPTLLQYRNEILYNRYSKAKAS